LWLSFPGPLTGSWVSGAHASCACTHVAATPSLVPVTGFLFGLCSRWLRLHSCRRHQLSLLWRHDFQGQCRLQLPCLAPLSAVLTLAALLFAPPPAGVFAMAAGHPRPMPSPVPVTGALVGCARASSHVVAAISCFGCGGWLSMGNAVTMTGSLFSFARAGCACTRVTAIICVCGGGLPSQGQCCH
jgi:hypothetical protein